MPEKKVLLFGRTGDGKSTLANMLVSGHLRNPVFQMGDGMDGVTNECKVSTGRGYYVVDTVGLGEETDCERKHAKDLIYAFLKRTQGKYSHILFVKAAGRFDELDKEIWNIFLEVFGGSTKSAFGLVVTKCNNPAKWSRENMYNLQRRYSECENRFTFVNFPPVDEDDVDMEALLEEKRNASLRTLETAIDGWFQNNSFRYFHPLYATEDDYLLQKRSRTVFDFIMDIAKMLKNCEIWKQLFGGSRATFQEVY